ncbi:MAG TPA: hypothetical protein VFV50_10335 [Bdellovibrionales bacterium]|nr:hypothetical protein [Bdellovibrionales bacterium]
MLKYSFSSEDVVVFRILSSGFAISDVDIEAARFGADTVQTPFGGVAVPGPAAVPQLPAAAAEAATNVAPATNAKKLITGFKIIVYRSGYEAITIDVPWNAGI